MVWDSKLEKVYKKRIQNSGTHAMSPFTPDAVDKLCLAAHGRIRFAFDIAGSLIQKYADQPFPEVLDAHSIAAEAKEKISTISAKEDFTPKTKVILQHIVDHPGINSTHLAQETGISSGNLSKFLGTLIQNQLVEKIVEGRTVKHYPVGLAKLLPKKG